MQSNLLQSLKPERKLDPESDPPRSVRARPRYGEGQGSPLPSGVLDPFALSLREGGAESFGPYGVNAFSSLVVSLAYFTRQLYSAFHIIHEDNCKPFLDLEVEPVS